MFNPQGGAETGHSSEGPYGTQGILRHGNVSGDPANSPRCGVKTRRKNARRIHTHSKIVRASAVLQGTRFLLNSAALILEDRFPELIVVLSGCILDIGVCLGELSLAKLHNSAQTKVIASLR